MREREREGGGGITAEGDDDGTLTWTSGELAATDGDVGASTGAAGELAGKGTMDDGDGDEERLDNRC